MDKVQAVKGVSTKLFATEDAIDSAMVNASQLIEAIVTCRQVLKVSAVTAEVAQSRIAEAIGALSEARRAVITAHGALADVQHKLGIDDADVGPLDKPERPKTVAPLRVAS